MGKKGIFFSMDALIAVGIIFIVILMAVPLILNTKQKTELHYDLIKTLSTINIGELNNNYAATLLAEGSLSDKNKSVLEQIGEFYVTNITKARLLAESVMSDIPAEKNIGLWFGNTLIASRNITPFEGSSDTETARQMVTGIEEGKNITGFSARAYLASSLQSDYFYFGGYIGDGNLSIFARYNGTLSNAEAEIAINQNFTVYVNGQYAGNYTKPETELTPIRYTLPIQNFHSGENTIEFRAQNKIRITGGFLKIDYDRVPEYDKPERRYIPGVNGIINLYSGFSIPNTLKEMTINLHFKSQYRMFFKIGNITVFENSSASETTQTIANSELSSKLNYLELSNKTTPFRIGLFAATYAGNADVVLITDLSGSMDNKLSAESAGVERNCTDPNLYDSDTKKVSLAKCLDKLVVDTILEIPGNRVALAAFYGDESVPNKGRIYLENLNSNSTYLNSKIDSYSPLGGTCICCGINAAYKVLSEQSNSGKRKYIIVMSDGIPTHTCMAASGCTGTRTGLPSDEGLWLGASSGCYGGQDDCNVNDCNCAITNTNWSACRAHTLLNSTLYSIGFGNISSCALANYTLQSVAQCGKGRYFTSDNSTILEEFYTNISQEIISLSYAEQIANATGNFSNTVMYPDSYIELNYTKEMPPFGLVATIEKQFDNVDTATFSIPENASFVKATAISYSGPRWTATVELNNQTVYNLSNYGDDFTVLGDPYSFSLQKILVPQNNTVKITRGISPTNISSGSIYNKIIYTIVKNASAYTKICAQALGCSWNIQYDDGTNATIKVPSIYAGTDNCYYNENSQSYNDNDAFQVAVHNLLRKLDFDSDNKVDVKFTQQSLNIASSELRGLPYLWSTEAMVRKWA